MTTRRRTWIFATIILALATTGVPADAAKRGKKVFKAVVNGKKVKSGQRYVGLTAGGGTIAFSGTGTKYGGLRGVTKSVMVACANDLSLQTFPFTTTDCLASYSETRAPLSQKYWFQNVGGTEVTVDSYDGTRIAARFRTIQDLAPLSDPNLPPVSIEGEWRGPVQLPE